MQAILYTAGGPVNFNASTGQKIPSYSGRVENVDPLDDDTTQFAILDAFEAWGARKFGLLSAEPFVWYTHRDDSYDVADMATPHLFYALRMVWNHSVPEIWRVGDYKRHTDVSRWNEDYRRRAITELTRELVSREDDLNDDLRQQFHEIVLKTITILVLGL